MFGVYLGNFLKTSAVEAVRRDAYALRFVSEELRAECEVVLEAVKWNGEALQFALPELQRNHQVAQCLGIGASFFLESGAAGLD